MDIRQLRYLVQIIESGSIAKASRQLYIAQPALSLHVSRMEDEVGKPLLVRSARGVVPTDSGKALYQHAKQLLRLLEQSLVVARQPAGPLTGTVAIGLGPTTACLLGLPLMQHLEATLPGVRPVIVEGASGQLESMGRAGLIDLAILFTSQAAADLDRVPLLEEELFVILPVGSPLVSAGQVSLSLQEVSRLPLVLPSLRHAQRHRRIELEFQRAGLPLMPVQEIDSLPLLMRWVEAGKGATIQPFAAVQALGGDPARWLCMPIADVRVSRPSFLYSLPAARLPAAAAAVRQALISLVRQHAASGQWQGVVALPADASGDQLSL